MHTNIPKKYDRQKSHTITGKSVSSEIPGNYDSAIQKLDPQIEALDFSRLRFKNTQSGEGEFSEENWDKIELEYRRFWQLKLLYPEASLVPGKIVDKMWHQHILDTQAYREDCDRVFGYFLDHYPYLGIFGKDDYRQLVDAFKETICLYEKHFGSYPGNNPVNAARCQCHPCHVPGTCACRAPGTCK